MGSNLISEERYELMKRFNAPCYKKVALVVMGEPTSDFLARTHQLLLKEKQEQAELEWRQRKAERERKKAMELQQKQLEEARKKVQEEMIKKVEEMKQAGAGTADVAPAAEAV